MVGKTLTGNGAEMKNLPRVRLSAPTICFMCGGQLFEGQEVAAIWDTDLDGWKHRHTRSGLCHHRNRNVDHSLVMEVIENAKHVTAT